MSRKKNLAKAGISFGLFFVVLYFAFVAFLGPVDTLYFTFIVVFSVVVHEMGHLVMASDYAESLELFFIPFWGANAKIKLRHGVRITNAREALFLVNGPLFGAIASLLSLALYPFVPVNVKTVCLLSAGVNAGLTAFNLIPFPIETDGDRIYKIYWRYYGERYNKIVTFVTLVFCVCMTSVSMASVLLTAAMTVTMLAY